jgi:chromate reductase
VKILALSGSCRADSWNTRLLRAAGQLAPENVEIVPAISLDRLPHFNEDTEKDRFATGAVADFRRAMAGSDALLIATPEYNQSLPGVLKNALDWLSRSDPDPLQGKPVAVIGATVGPWGTRLAQAHLRHVLLVLGMRVVGAPLYLANAAGQLDANGEWQPQVQAKLRAVIAELAGAVVRECDEEAAVGRRFPCIEASTAMS